MKKIFSVLLPILTISAGCQVTEPFPAARLSAEEARVNLRIEMQCSPPATRMGREGLEEEPENAIMDGIILEFNQDGELLETVTFSGTALPVLPVRRYQQTEIYIVANPTVDLSGVSSKEEYLQAQSEYRVNSSGRFEMTGHLSGVFDTDATVSVAMERTVAKITMDALVIRVTTNKINYTGAHLRRAFIEKTPATCGYDHTPSGNYLNAYEQGIGIGFFTSYPVAARKYTQGEYKVWEFDCPMSVYCYPNDSEDGNKRNRFAVSYRLVYTVPGIDAATGEPIVLTRYDDNTVHLVLPPVRHNTSYELERLTITGANNRTVYLGTRSGQEEESITCSFRMMDMTSGEYLGTVEGEVEYEMEES